MINNMETFSRYYNFRFEKNGVRVWRVYGIGPGKIMQFSDLISEQQVPTGLNVHEGLFPFQDIRVYKTSSQDNDAEHEGLFYCSEPGCQMVFKAFSELQNQVDVGGHSNAEMNSRYTLYDKLRRYWAYKFLTVDMRATDVSSNTTESDHPQSRLPSRQKQTKPSLCDLQMGWALHRRRDASVCFGENVKDYLRKKIQHWRANGVVKQILRRLQRISGQQGHSMALGSFVVRNG